MKVFKFLLTTLIFLLSSAIIVTTVRAQQVIRMEEMIVKGRVQKPQAMYILQRSTHVTFETSIKNKREDFRLYILEAIREYDDLFSPGAESKK